MAMDWATGIQRALDYVEARLTGEIDFEEAAKKAYSSSFHFQRMFSLLCGYTLGDYIRMRRLSLAAEELTRTSRRVIEIALKYGYDTPESFTRAFTRFHGITPSEARRGGNVKSFSRLFVKLILSGGKTMDYRIEKKEAFRLICKKKQVNHPQGETATADISAFWTECAQDGTMQALCKYGRFDHFEGILGVCFSGEMADSGFPYGIGAELCDDTNGIAVEFNGDAVSIGAENNSAPVAEAGLSIVEIPAHTYAVFQCKGPMPDAFKNTYQQICTEFFPQSEYEYGNGVELEVYPSDDTSDPNYSCEIWIAVNKKK